MLSIEVVSNEVGDWQGLYCNGGLVYENHKITAYDIIRFLSSIMDIRYDFDLVIEDSKFEELCYSMPKELPID